MYRMLRARLLRELESSCACPLRLLDMIFADACVPGHSGLRFDMRR